MALLATMLAIALMTIIVVDFTSSSALGYLSAANHANEIRSAFLARSAVNVGLALIAQDTRAQSLQPASSGPAPTSQPFDSFASVWAIPFPPMPVDGGWVQLSVVDEARKFNINKLIITQAAASGGAPNVPQQQVGQIDPNAVQQLVRLIGILGLSPAIAPAIVDWLDKDSIDSPDGGAESDYYLGLRPPYEPRNGPMPTLGDLHLIRGIDDIAFLKLSQYLTVAPEKAVNPNTASPEVLACLEPELTQNPRAVEAIIQARMIKPFTNITDVMNIPDLSSAGTKLSKDLTTRGEYFTISGVGKFAGARKLVVGTFQRIQDGTAVLGSWQED